MYHVRFTRICNRGLFPHIFAAYFAITWSVYFEKNVRVFLTCLCSLHISRRRGRFCTTTDECGNCPSCMHQQLNIRSKSSQTSGFANGLSVVFRVALAFALRQSFHSPFLCHYNYRCLTFRDFKCCSPVS